MQRTPLSTPPIKDIIPYVKLIKNGVQLKMPSNLSLTKKSKDLLKIKAKDGQGFIFFLDLEDGKIHLLAANNPEKSLMPTPTSSTSQDDSIEKKQLEIRKKKNRLEQEKKAELLGKLKDQQEIGTLPHLSLELIQQLVNEINELDKDYQQIQHAIQKLTHTKTIPLTAELKLIVPTDREGKPYNRDEFATTTREKTPTTGGAGNGDLHANGERVLGFGPDRNVLAGGFWIKWLGDVPGEKLGFADFRTRSTANTKIIRLNPLYRFIFNMRTDGGNEVGHTQVYARELPEVYLLPIIDVFIQASKDNYLENAAKKNLNIANLEEDLLQPVKRSLLPTKVNLPFKYQSLQFVATDDFSKWGYEYIPNYIIFIDQIENQFKIYWREDDDMICVDLPQNEIHHDLQLLAANRALPQKPIIEKIVAAYQCIPSQSVIPAATRWHLAIEHSWRISDNHILRVEIAISERKKSLRKTEAESLLKAFFDDYFPENQQLLEKFFNAIKNKKDAEMTVAMVELLKDYFNEWIDSQLTVASHDAKNSQENSRVVLINKLLTALPKFNFIQVNADNQNYKAAEHLFKLRGDLLTNDEICILIKTIVSIDPIPNSFLSLLLQKKPDLKKMDGYTALHVCMEMENPDSDLVRMLCENNPKIAQENLYARTPLFIGVEKGHFDLVWQLLQDIKIVEAHSLEKLYNIARVFIEKERDILLMCIKNENFQLLKNLCQNRQVLALYSLYKLYDLIKILEEKKQYHLVRLLFQTKGELLEIFLQKLSYNNLKKETSVRQFIIDNLNQLEEKEINPTNLIIFLKCYCAAPIKKTIYQKFYAYNTENKKQVASKLIEVLNNKTATMTVKEIALLVNTSCHDNSLLRKIIFHFISIAELQGIRNAIAEYCERNKKGEYILKSNVDLLRELQISQSQFVFTETQAACRQQYAI